MKNLFLVMMAISVPTILGQMVLKAFFSQIKFFIFERICMSFGLGFGIITIAMFYLSVAGYPLSTMNTMACTFIPMTILYVIFTKRKGQEENRPIDPEREKWTPVSVSLLLAAIFAIGLLFFRTFVNTYDAWDNWAVWAFKARIYFTERGIPFGKFIQFRDVWGNWDYPHHLPLMEAWLCFWTGNWNDQWLRAIPPLFHLGIFVGAYAYLRRNVSRTSSLIGSFLVLTLPGLTRMTAGSLSEPVIIYYYMTSFFLLLEWDKSRSTSLLILSAIFGALAAWTKNEGVIYGVFNLLIIFCMTRQKDFLKSFANAILYISFYAVTLMPWFYIKTKLGLKNLLINSQYLTLGEWRQSIGDSLAKGFENLYTGALMLDFFNVSWIMFFILLVLNIKSLFRRPYIYLLVSVFMNMALVLIFSVIDPTQRMLEDSFFRLLLFPTVLMIIYSVSIQNESICSKQAQANDSSTRGLKI